MARNSELAFPVDDVSFGEPEITASATTFDEGDTAVGAVLRIGRGAPNRRLC